MKRHLEAAAWTALVVVIVFALIFQIGPLRRALTTPHLGKLSA